MTCTNRTRPRIDVGDNQGRDSEESLQASRRCLGITGDPMESSTVRWFAVLAFVIALVAIFTRSYPQ